MSTIFKDYCKTSTLHIIRHIGDSEKSVVESFTCYMLTISSLIGKQLLRHGFMTWFTEPSLGPESLTSTLDTSNSWAICLWAAVLVVFSAALAQNFMEDWNTMRHGPLRVIVEDPPIGVGNVDFPSLTVCPNHAIDPDKMNHLMRRVLGPDVDDETARRFIETLKAITLVINPQFDKGHLYLVKRKITPFPIRSDDIIPFLKEVTPSLDDIFEKCYWKGTGFNCSDLIRNQITEQGFCYSFNNFFSSRNYNESEILPPYLDSEGNFMGIRTNSEGRTNGLELFLRAKDNMSRDDILFTVVLSSPNIIPPTNNMRPIRPRPTMVYRAQVEVEFNNIDQSLQEMEPSSLPCSLDAQEPAENCLFRCRHRHIYELCQCVLYTHAALLANESVPVCGVPNMKCLFDIAGSLNYIRLDLPPGVPTFNDSRGMECSCKPPCSDITYLATFQTTPRETNISELYYSAYIDVYYFSKWAMGYLKRTKLTTGDVIVGLGGTGGLYLGASFISFVEISVVLFKVILWYLTPRNYKSKTKIIKVRSNKETTK